MLDKTIDFHTIIMKNRNLEQPALPTLPDGFTIRFYQNGDDNNWADIQCAVGEFKCKQDALECYQNYLSQIEYLKQRQLFVIENHSGKTVATATAWYGKKEGKEIGVVHALSCLQEYQSFGLGKVAAAYMMDCFYKLMKGKEVWLDTQTWSYKAIGIYMSLGFIPLRTSTFNETENQYDDAVKVMKGKMREDIYRRFIELVEQ